TKALAYVQGEDVWETRFLAPATMTDGSYGCTLVLTDAAGRKVREEKRFTIDSKPPDVKVSLSHGSARPGDRVVVTTLADRDVRARVGDPAGARCGGRRDPRQRAQGSRGRVHDHRAAARRRYHRRAAGEGHVRAPGRAGRQARGRGHACLPGRGGVPRGRIR